MCSFSSQFQNLVFTMDGLKPFVFEMMSDDLQLENHLLVWGATYDFKIALSVGK